MSGRSHNNRGAVRAVTALLALLLTGICVVVSACSATPPPQPAPTAIDVRMNVVVSADVNPDLQNRPSPIVVRIYQLKDDAAFRDAEFFALYDREQPTLAASLVSRNEFELLPGERRAVDMSFSTDTRFIAVAAAYRDIREADWRAVCGRGPVGVIATAGRPCLAIAVNRTGVGFVAPKSKP